MKSHVILFTCCALMGCGAESGTDADSEMPTGTEDVASAAQPLSLLELLTDRCSGAVAISDVGTGESILMFRNIPGDPLQPFSAPPISISKRRLTWFCFDSKTSISGARTEEHSTCPSGTHHISARLGPSRLLNIRCLT